jgi:endonuclease III related protein
MEAATEAGQSIAAVTLRAHSVRKATSKPQRASSPGQTIRAIYRKLSRAWGPQHWWPAETPFEVIIGAILTQNTSWTNVERALSNLREAGALSVEGIRGLALDQLESLVRPSGYFRQKALRLKDFIAFLDATYGGSLDSMLATPTQQLRAELLAQKGIGPETADSILLYAGHHPAFVVDAYTRRVLERHEAVAANADYDEIRTLVERALRREKPSSHVPPRPPDRQRPEAHSPSPMSTATRAPLAQVYNEMHGLFVQLGKHYCHKQQPKCDVCPLGAMLLQPVQSRSLPTAHKEPSHIKRRASRVRRNRGYNEARP